MVTSTESLPALAGLICPLIIFHVHGFSHPFSREHIRTTNCYILLLFRLICWHGVILLSVIITISSAVIISPLAHNCYYHS